MLEKIKVELNERGLLRDVNITVVQDDIILHTVMQNTDDGTITINMQGATDNLMRAVHNILTLNGHDVDVLTKKDLQNLTGNVGDVAMSGLVVHS